MLSGQMNGQVGLQSIGLLPPSVFSLRHVSVNSSECVDVYKFAEDTPCTSCILGSTKYKPYSSRDQLLGQVSPTI